MRKEQIMNLVSKLALMIVPFLGLSMVLWSLGSHDLSGNFYMNPQFLVKVIVIFIFLTISLLFTLREYKRSKAKIQLASLIIQAFWFVIFIIDFYLTTKTYSGKVENIVFNMNLPFSNLYNQTLYWMIAGILLFVLEIVYIYKNRKKVS